MDILNATNSNSSINKTGLYCTHFTKHQCWTLLDVKRASTGVSLVLTLIAVILALLLNKYKVLPQRIVLMMILSDWISNLISLFHDGQFNDSEQTSCAAIGYFTQMFDMMAISWMLALAIFILLRVRFNKDTATYQWVYMLVVWVPALILSALPIELYGQAGAWCWIIPTKEGHLYRIFLYWIPVIIGCVGVAVIFIYLYVSNRGSNYTGNNPESRRLRDEKQRLLDEYLKPYIGIAIAYLIFQVIPFSNRLNDWVSDVESYPFHIVHALCVSFTGVVYSCMMFTTNSWSDFHPRNVIGGISRIRDDIKGCCSRLRARRQDSVHPAEYDIGVTTPGPTSPVSTLRNSPKDQRRKIGVLSPIASRDTTDASPETSTNVTTQDDIESDFVMVNDALDSISLSDVDDGPTPSRPPRRRKNDNSLSDTQVSPSKQTEEKLTAARQAEEEPSRPPRRKKSEDQE